MRVLVRILLVALLLSAAAPVAACPNCKAAVMADDKGDALSAEQQGDYSQGINYSIYFLIGSIYGVTGGFTLLMLRAYRDYEPGRPAGQQFRTAPKGDLA